MSNHSPDSSEGKINPHRGGSTLRYSHTDGWIGYISEVYTASGDRDGKRLRPAHSAPPRDSVTPSRRTHSRPEGEGRRSIACWFVPVP